jgi:hypothetical protein
MVAVPIAAAMVVAGPGAALTAALLGRAGECAARAVPLFLRGGVVGVGHGYLLALSGIRGA